MWWRRCSLSIRLSLLKSSQDLSGGQPLWKILQGRTMASLYSQTISMSCPTPIHIINLQPQIITLSLINNSTTHSCLTTKRSFEKMCCKKNSKATWIWSTQMTKTRSSRPSGSWMNRTWTTWTTSRNCSGYTTTCLLSHPSCTTQWWPPPCLTILSAQWLWTITCMPSPSTRHFSPWTYKNLARCLIYEWTMCRSTPWISVCLRIGSLATISLLSTHSWTSQVKSLEKPASWSHSSELTTRCSLWTTFQWSTLTSATTSLAT